MVEIHIPKRGIHARLEPRRVDEDGLPDDLSQLRAMEAYEKQAIERLERSNGELKKFLDEEDDPDFREAITDNLKILATKKDRLGQIQAKILQIMPPEEARAQAQRLAREDGGYVRPAGLGIPEQGRGPENEVLPTGLDL
mmetsp:Transcript_45220/g.84401  ORF Transcript_45220/g.84401 Transcript_45220/m.84401 type:complete len:140 (-) Transcript_45220:45-464(-)